MSTREEKATLWELLKDYFMRKQEEPEELKIFNPLKLKIGDFVTIDAANLYGKQLVASELDVYERKIGGEKFEFVNYVLLDDENHPVNLRVHPIKDSDPYGKKHCDALVVLPDFEMAYDKGFHENVLPTGVLEVKDDKGNVLATYQRVGESKEPYLATVTVLDNPDSAPKREKYSYWDYVREIDGSTEFYFVEMNDETGWIQMFKGFPVSELDVKVFRKKD